MQRMTDREREMQERGERIRKTADKMQSVVTMGIKLGFIALGVAIGIGTLVVCYVLAASMGFVHIG